MNDETVRFSEKLCCKGNSETDTIPVPSRPNDIESNFHTLTVIVIRVAKKSKP